MLAYSGEPWGLEGERGRKLIHVCEISTGKERCRFECPDEGRLGLAFSPGCRILAAGSLDITTLLWDLTGELHKASTLTRSATEINKLWDDLKSEDGAVAYRAIWELARTPNPSTAFLARVLRAPTTPDPKRIAELVRALADKKFQVREQASADLLKLEELSQPMLLEALRASPDLELQRRIEHLLKLIGAVPPEKRRQLRAVEALERMRSATADDLLRRLSRGNPALWLTREAAEAEGRRQRAH
jgi:hypothetical protein